MDVVSFRAALARCGLTDLLSQDSLIDQGYDNMVMFAVDVKGNTRFHTIHRRNFVDNLTDFLQLGWPL